MFSFLSTKTTTKKNPIDAGPINTEDDDSISRKLEQMLDDMDSIIAEVSNEIDDDYKHDIVPPQPSSNGIHIPNFVIPIHSIHDLYSYQSQIGRGITGPVYLAQSNQSFKQYALKRMLRSDKLNLYSFLNEITVLHSLNHPHIVNLNDAYLTDKHYFVTTEYCNGGTLHKRIMQMKRFSERDCVGFMRTILDAVQYIHAKQIVHRDLKLSNIVFDTADMKHSKLKIIDFGESEFIDKPQTIDKSTIGSLHFLPPETNRIRKKHELFAGDMWAIGVIAYTLIEGAFPYKPKRIPHIKSHIDKTPLQWNANIPISDSCKDFIQSLLHKDISKRLTAPQALAHKWITNQATDKNLGDEYFSRLQHLTFRNKLQQVLVKAVLHEMTETDKKLVLEHDGYEDDTELINTILSEGTSLESFAAESNQNDAKQMPYKHTACITDVSLDEIAIDDILAEIDAETEPSSCDANQKEPKYSIKSFTPQTMLMSPDSTDTVTPLTPGMDDTIATERFVGMLQSSVKKYDIPQIVRQVTKDGTEPITYRRIASFHAPMDSLDIESHDYF